MQVQYLSPLVVERVEQGWRLYSEFRVNVDGEAITIPAGYFTDFASVPRLPLAYYLAGGRGVRAATLHDYLYEKRHPRDWADSVFYHALLAEGEPKFIAKAMHDAVRLAGGSQYREDGPPLEVVTVDSVPTP